MFLLFCFSDYLCVVLWWIWEVGWVDRCGGDKKELDAGCGRNPNPDSSTSSPSSSRPQHCFHHHQNHHHHLDKKELDAECGRNSNPGSPTSSPSSSGLQYCCCHDHHYHHHQNHHHHHHLDKKELEAERGKNPNPLTFSIQEMMARDKRLPQPFFSTTMQIYEISPHFRGLDIVRPLQRVRPRNGILGLVLGI